MLVLRFAAQRRVPERRPQKPLDGRELADRDRPRHRGAQVVPDLSKSRLSLGLAGTCDQRRRLLDDLEVMREMPVPQRGSLAPVVESFLAVLAKRLEHPVPHRVAVARCGHHRLVNQRTQHVDDDVDVEGAVGADAFGCVEIEAAGEHTRSREQQLLLVIEQLIRPCHCGPQCLMTLEAAATRPPKQLEAVVEPRQQIGRTERTDPGRGQFDRQRDPVQTTADLADRRAVLGREHQRLVRRVGTVHEEQDRVVGSERRHTYHPLAGDAERFATRRQHGHSGDCGSDRLDQLAHRTKHVLTVVDDQQHAPPAQPVDHRLRGRHRLLRRSRQRRRHRRRDRVRIRDWS